MESRAAMGGPILFVSVLLFYRKEISGQRVMKRNLQQELEILRVVRNASVEPETHFWCSTFKPKYKKNLPLQIIWCLHS